MLRDFLFRLMQKKNFGYRNFGYIPSGWIKGDIYGFLFGFPNFLKRMQAKDIIESMDIKLNDIVLDFGCGTGYISLEMARLGGNVIGVDVGALPAFDKIKVSGSIEFVQVKPQEKLPFPDKHFDKILASEVLPMVEDPRVFLSELNRVLKDDGKLIICQLVGHPELEKFLSEKNEKYLNLKSKYSTTMPNDYASYSLALNKYFGTEQKEFVTEDKLIDYISIDFEILKKQYSPGNRAFHYFSFNQFNKFIKGKDVIKNEYFPLKYFFYSFINFFDKSLKEKVGGVVLVSRKKQ